MTIPTQNAIPSGLAQDFRFNVEKTDEEVNSTEYYYTDRFGVRRLTNEGRNKIFNDKLLSMGWQEMGDFTPGIVINNRSQIVFWDGSWYQFVGPLPYVTATDNPNTDGGIFSETNPGGLWVNLGVDLSLRSDIADSDGATLIGCKMAASTAIARTQDDKNNDYVTVLDFGADRTGVLDSTQAFQNALDACSDRFGEFGHGRCLHIPGGNYKISDSLKYAWRASDTSKNDGDNRRLSISGDGDACTFIEDVRVNPGNVPLLDIDGGITDPTLRISLSGFRIWRPSLDRTSIGVFLKNISIADISNCSVQWFGSGAVFRDCIIVQINHTQLGANVVGMTASRINWTNPNVFDLQNVMFSANSGGAAVLTDAANVKFDSCTFEGNGSDRATHSTLQYDGGTSEGGPGMIVKNCYFEGNQVLADINIGGGSPNDAGFIIEANTLQRNSPDRYCQQHILFRQLNPAGKHRCHIRANTFRWGGGYVHSPGEGSITAATPYTEIFEEGNTYQPQQPPSFGQALTDGYINRSVLTASVSVAGSPSLFGGYNALSVERTSTGFYRVYLKKPLSSPDGLVAVASSLNVIGSAHIYGYTETYIIVATTDATGALSDIVPFNVIATGIML